MSDVQVRSLAKADYDQWLQLYYGYADHYKFTLTEDSIQTTWGWLMDAAHPVQGLVAVHDDRLVGLAHVRPMPSPLRGKVIGFLDDLFVDHGQRGNGVVEALMTRLKAMAQDNEWEVIRWITRDNNYRARRVYDKYAGKTDWNLYEMSC
ncbi:MAG TPA: GNAT family N-acetyltransferase [Alphaproteobacteria bacterium]|nr:GNAT family N-acetyltransferase [Alphaproteobacteria bacterium]